MIWAFFYDEELVLFAWGYTILEKPCIMETVNTQFRVDEMLLLQSFILSFRFFNRSKLYEACVDYASRMTLYM